MGVDVFIVHASTDKPFACRLADALATLGISTFLDAFDLEAGARWDTSIAAALEDSLLQPVLVGTAGRWYQLDEIAAAIQRQRALGAGDRVVPILLEPHAALPYGLDGLQAIAWNGADEVAAALANKVRRLRGHDLGSKRIRIAVLGVDAELKDTLTKLRERLGQRAAILAGEVVAVDLASGQQPEVDLRVVVLGSRHAGQLPGLSTLVDAALAQRPDTIVGGLAIQYGKIAKPLRSEAAEIQDLHDRLTITADTAALLIDELDGAVARWYVTRYPSQPGRSAVREPWEECYLRDKASLWRRGNSSGLPGIDGAPPERGHWFVHLKASQPWIEVAGQIRFAVPRRVRRLSAAGWARNRSYW